MLLLLNIKYDNESEGTFGPDSGRINCYHYCHFIDRSVFWKLTLSHLNPKLKQ